LFYWQTLTVVLTVAIIALVSFALWTHRVSLADASQPETIVSSVLTRNQPTRVVLGDLGLAYMTQTTKHVLSVAEYANRSYPTVHIEPPLKAIWDRLSDGTTMNFPDVKIAATIMRQTGVEGRDAVLLNSRQLTTQDFRSGNMIIVSSPLGCPWLNLFENKLNFRYRRTFGQSEDKVELVNTHPRPGEEPSYAAETSTPRFGTTYAVLARVPNLSGNGKILLVYGLKPPGFQAAGEYATDPKSAQELTRVFKVGQVNELPDFELLLGTDSMASTPLNVHIVASRIID
jgi:hypothetical protein